MNLSDFLYSAFRVSNQESYCFPKIITKKYENPLKSNGKWTNILKQVSRKTKKLHKMTKDSRKCMFLLRESYVEDLYLKSSNLMWRSCVFLIRSDLKIYM